MTSVTPALKHPDMSWATSSLEKAKVLASAWFPPLAQIPGLFPTPECPLPCMCPYFEVTRKEIDDALDDTSNTSAPGISGLNYKVLKWAYSLHPVAIHSVIKASICLGIHHPRWKSALVVAVPKPGKKDYSTPRSHHPIQLIECLGKLVEKIVAKHLTFNAGKYDLLPFNQFGGRSNSSCLDAGLSLTHNIQTACHKGLISSFLAVDIKGFFDHVHHDHMIHILWTKGFPIEIRTGCGLSFLIIPSKSELTISHLPSLLFTLASHRVPLFHLPFLACTQPIHSRPSIFLQFSPLPVTLLAPTPILMISASWPFQTPSQKI